MTTSAPPVITIVRVNFSSPAADPLKVPRPYVMKRLDGVLEVLGGEIGGTLVGITPSYPDPPTDPFNPDQWIDADTLWQTYVEGDRPEPTAYAGWHPVVVDEHGDMATGGYKIEDVTVSLRGSQPPVDIGNISPEGANTTWVGSNTRTHVQRRPRQPDDTTVTHTAIFSIRPGAALDLDAEYTPGITFRPDVIVAKWIDGQLHTVTVSGGQRLKSGGVSEKKTQRRSWESRWRSGPGITPVDPTDLPGPVATAIVSYAEAVAVASSGAHA